MYTFGVHWVAECGGVNQQFYNAKSVFLKVNASLRWYKEIFSEVDLAFYDMSGLFSRPIRPRKQTIHVIKCQIHLVRQSL